MANVREAKARFVLKLESLYPVNMAISVHAKHIAN